MNKKGFTLVELLAVIVILAIISLITIPIVLNVITSSEEEGEKNSIKGYVRTIENDVANYIMLNSTKKYIDYNINIEEKLNNLVYKGNTVICSNVEVLSNGKVELSDCFVTSKSREEITDIVKEGNKKRHYNYQKGKIVKISDIAADDESNDTSSKVAVQQLLSKINPATVTTYETGSNSSHQMYTFTHSETSQTDALTDYRYIGSDPYNYVEFNGKMWRIIGIFTVEDENGKKEQRIKIIPNDPLNSDMPWDSKYKNEWNASTLYKYLNEYYYTNTLVKNNAKEMISPAKYYLGGTSQYQNIGAENFYNYERGNERYDDSRSLNVTTYVGLMYLSDYLYTYAYGVDDKCYNTGNNCNIISKAVPSAGWIFNTNGSMHQWTMVTGTSANSTVFYININGNIQASGNSTNYSGVRPVVYLKSTVKISSGTGTSNDPYKLKI